MDKKRRKSGTQFVEVAQKKERGRRRLTPAASYRDASKSVSRVLCFAAIYLDPPLPMGSSRLPGTAGPAICPSTALLRIEFTAPFRLRTMGELLPRLSTLTAPAKPLRRYISVALVLGSPPAGVTRYPCPMKPGLSSRTDFRPVPAAARLTRRVYFTWRTACLSTRNGVEFWLHKAYNK